MSIRQLTRIGWRFGGWACLAVPILAWSQAPLSLQQVLEAASANLEVNISRSALEAARADITSADRSPFPVLSARTSSIDLQNGLGGGNTWRDKRIDKGLGLDITQERGNKRELRTRSAQSSARAAEQDLVQTQRAQRVLASVAYFNWLGQTERLQQVKVLVQTSRQLAETAQKRQQAGDLSRQDMLRWQIEASRAQAELPVSSANLQRALETLRQITRLEPPDQGWRPAQGWPDANGEWEDTKNWSQRLNDWLSNRPDVMAAQERLEASRQALELAMALKKSDITWGGSIDHYPGTSSRLLELRLQIPLQWGYGHQGEIARAQAQLMQSQDLLAQTRLQARAEINGFYQDLISAQRRWLTHRDQTGPQAQQVLEQAQQAWLKGAISLTDLLDARRTYQQTWFDGLSARMAFAMAYSSLLWQEESVEMAQQKLLSSTPPYGVAENRP